MAINHNCAMKKFKPYWRVVQKLVFISAILISVSSCASYQYSNKTEQETVSMSIHENPTMLDLRTLETQEIPEYSSRSSIFGQAASLAFSGIKYMIDKEKKKYTASYKSSKQHLYFYSNISDKGAFDPSFMQFEGFDITRTFQNEKGQLDTALYISFAVDQDNLHEIINNSIFRLKVEEFQMNYSKVKIPASKWYTPWTWFLKERNTVNLQFEIDINASWVTEGGSIYDNQNIGKFYLSLFNIPLEKGSKEYEQYIAEQIGRQLAGYSFLVPRSHGYYRDNNYELKQCHGQGKYNITATITEAGKNHFVQKVVHDKSDEILKTIKGSVMKKIK